MTVLDNMLVGGPRRGAPAPAARRPQRRRHRPGPRAAGPGRHRPPGAVGGPGHLLRPAEAARARRRADDRPRDDHARRARRRREPGADRPARHPGPRAQRRGPHVHHRRAQHGDGDEPEPPRRRLRPRRARSPRASRPRSRTTRECWRPTLASETPTPDYLLELDDIEAGYGRAALVLRGLTVQVPPGRDRLPGRPERRRQVHRAQGRQRHARPRAPARSGWPASTSPATARRT